MRIDRSDPPSALGAPPFIPNGYVCVYEGGHHDVYCNGSRHIWTRGGGYTELSKPKFGREGKCDCKDWAKK